MRRQGACYVTVELVFFYVKRCALHVLEIALQRQAEKYYLGGELSCRSVLRFART